MTTPSATKAPVSACLIVRDDPHLLTTLKCLEPWVEEMVVVFTSKEVGDEPGEAVIAACAETGAMLVPLYGVVDKDGILKSFAQARNQSFRFAKQPWILWTDSDDEIVGLDNLRATILLCDAAMKLGSAPKALRVCAYYETEFDEERKCTRRVVRERLVPNLKNMWQWERPVHERLRAKDRSKEVDVMIDSIVWKHRPGKRDESKHTDRNIAILEKFLSEQLKAGIEDDRTYHDLGSEYFRSDHVATLKQVEMGYYYLAKCYTISKTPEDKANAALLLSSLFWKLEHRTLPKDPQKTLHWAELAIQACGRFEDYFAKAKVAWTFALATQRETDIVFARIYTERALDVPIGTHPDPNPTDRSLAKALLLDLDKRKLGEPFTLRHPLVYGGISITSTLNENRI